MQKKTRKNFRLRIGVWLKKNWWLIAILGLGFLLRAVFPLTRSFPFQFDHGKDSIAVMDILVNGELKFVGPWTSIPGLFFGPFWYYFLAICYLLGGLDPAAGVWGMVILSLVQVWLMYKYFGKLPALVTATGSLWVTIGTSAWNPFPLTLISLVVLIILKKITETKNKRELPWWLMLSLGLLVGLGFSFSSAYAFFYFLIIPLCLWVAGWKWNGRQVGWMVLGLVIPFLPQILFEIKHNFGEVRAILSYFGSGGESGDVLSWERVFRIWSEAGREIQQAFLPIMKTTNTKFNDWWLKGMTVIFAGVVVWWGWQKLRSKNEGAGRIKTVRWTRMSTIYLVFIFLPLIGLTFLHFNTWYLLGMMPAVVLLTSQFFVVCPKWFKTGWALALIAAGVSGLATFWLVDKNTVFQSVPTFIGPKEKMIAKIEETAVGRNFRVFVFAPDIYDFAYQYLWLREMRRNPDRVAALQEFAYKPMAEEYVKEKDRLLIRTAIDWVSPEEAEKELVFYIIEGENWGDDFERWKGQQLHPNKDDWRELLTLKRESGEPEELWLYVVEPKDQD